MSRIYQRPGSPYWYVAWHTKVCGPRKKRESTGCRTLAAARDWVAVREQEMAGMARSSARKRRLGPSLHDVYVKAFLYENPNYLTRGFMKALRKLTGAPSLAGGFVPDAFEVVGRGRVVALEVEHNSRLSRKKLRKYIALWSECKSLEVELELLVVTISPANSNILPRRVDLRSLQEDLIHARGLFAA